MLAQDNTPRPESSWHWSTHVVPPANGGEFSLKAQTDAWRTVIKLTHGRIRYTIVVEDAWFLVTTRAAYAYRLVLELSKIPAAAIYARIVEEKKLPSGIADLVRVSG
jgi:hypothetical protein